MTASGLTVEMATATTLAHHQATTTTRHLRHHHNTQQQAHLNGNNDEDSKIKPMEVDNVVHQNKKEETTLENTIQHQNNETIKIDEEKVMAEKLAAEKAAAKQEKYAAFKQRKDQEDFNARLVDFHRHKSINAPITSWPTFNGRAIDLHKLYVKVVDMGGWERVCEKEKWSEVCTYMDKNVLGSCTNAAHALKLVYLRYLSLYERVHTSQASLTVITQQTLNANATPVPVAYLIENYLKTNSINSLMPTTTTSSFNSTNGSIIGGVNGFSTGGFGYNANTNTRSVTFNEDKEDELMSGKRRFNYLYESVPMNYNYSQHVINTVPPGTTASSFDLINGTLSANQATASTTTSTASSTIVFPSSTFTFNPYEKLEISLSSGLPNEIDFVFNTIVLLSSDESHAFRVYSSPRLIQLILAHIGFFGIEDKHNYRHMYDRVWNIYEDDKVFRCDEKNEEDDYFNDRMVNKLKCKPRRNFVKYWHNAIKFPEYNETLDFDYNELFGQLLPKLYNNYIKNLPAQELLNLREMKEDINGNNCTPRGFLESVEYRRIEQVMVSLNNLSFEESNADYMANKCLPLIEFLVMCLYCTGSSIELRKHSLDILANLSRKLKLKNLSDKHQSLLLMSIFHLIVGQHQEPDSDHLVTSDFEASTASATEIAATVSFNLSSQDRWDIVRGIEILTKLCSQNFEANEEDNLTNEKILARFILAENTNFNLLETIIGRLEHLLSIKDVLILMHCLECLYSMSQFSEQMCNIIVQSTIESSSSSSATPKIVSLLINFLTVDTTHFGVTQSTNSSSSRHHSVLAPIKISKIMPTNASLIIQSSSSTSTINNSTASQSLPTNTSINKTSTSLLQQTLHNQHNINATAASGILNTKGQTVNSYLNNNSQLTSSKPNPHEQNAKTALSTWLTTCFQPESNSELTKTQLYPYYQQIAKLNSWPVLTIPTFFEILNATFPNLKYDENSNKIQGLKLVLNVKQQIQLKNQKQFTQQPLTLSNTVVASSNVNSVSKTTPITVNVVTQPSTTTNINNEQLKSNSTETNQLSPMPNVSIHIQTPSIPLLTPPTPPVNVNSPLDSIQKTHQSTTSVLQTNDLNVLNSNSNEISSSLSSSSSLESNKTLQIKKDLHVKENGVNGGSTGEEKLLENIESRISLIKEANCQQQNGIHKNSIEPHLQNGHTNGENEEKEEISEKENIKAQQLVNGTNREHLSNENKTSSTDVVNTALNVVVNDENSSSSTTSSLTSSSLTSSSSSSSENEMTNLRKRKLSSSNNNDSNEMSTSPKKKSLKINEMDNLTNGKPQDDSKKNDAPQVEAEKKESSSLSTTIENNVTFNNVASSAITTASTTTQSNENSQTSHNLQHSQQQQQIEDAKTNVEGSTGSQQTQANVITKNNNENVNSVGDYLCEWNNCKRAFSTAKAVYNHVCKYHLSEQLKITETSSETSGLLCLWSYCDQVKRQKWSLVNHLQERHCNENALKTAFLFRQRGLIPASNYSSASNVLINYSKDAALIAIQRNQKVKREDFFSPEEGPITKSIRLLSALTLRNLAKNSEKAKISIKQYETILANIAFDLMESSNAIATCLWHLSH